MAIEYNFTLDMDRSKRDNNIAYARTGDVDSITINADLVLNGAAYTPTGTNAFFECVTPNGHSVRAAAEKTGSSVSVEVPSAAFQAAGVINVAYFRFETGDSSNPTYVESTEPFAIVVREGIGDDIDAGDYIEEWRGLADKLEAAVAEVEQKAEQAETAINEQKTEVDQLKAQAQTSIAQDTEDVSDAKDTAISNINGSQGAVDAAIEQLEQKTQEAVDAAQDALDGTLATDLKNEINRTLKLDVADMVNISDNTSLSSFTAVGSYCCKTASAAATIGDCPIDDSPFNMYVFSSATSGQVMQLVVPIDLQGRSSAEWYVRFGTSSAMDNWSVIGGMPDVVPVSQGGTGATTAEQARQNLGAGTSDFSGDYNDLMNKPNIPTVPVSIANGGTGATSASSARTNLGALGPSSVYAGSGISVSTSGNTVTITASGALDLNTYVKNALEALTDEPSMLVNLASTTAADVFEESPRPGVTGTLTIAHGGTGYTSNPSIRVNLGSTSSDNLFGSSSVTPGVTGTLAVARGGTGVTSLSALANNLSQYLGSDASIYVGSKVITSGGNWVTLFSSSQYRSLTGHTFNQSSDCVVVMNGDSDADISAMYAATYRSSSGNVGVQKASAQTPVRVNYIVISTV